MTIQDDLLPSADALVKRAKPRWHWTPLVSIFSIITIVATLAYSASFVAALVGGQHITHGFIDASQLLLAPLLAVVIIVTASLAGRKGGKGRLVGLVCGLVTLLFPLVVVTLALTDQTSYSS